MHYYPAICYRTCPAGRRAGANRCRLTRPYRPVFAGFRMRLLALNKPFGTICQFSPHETRASLADWVKVPGVYPAGRLDSDS
jgi:23S rRNA pseudouridine2457 synthase